MPYVLGWRAKYREVIMSTLQECRQERHSDTAFHFGHFAYGLIRRQLGGGSGWYSSEDSPFLLRKPFQDLPRSIVQIEQNLQELQKLLSSEIEVLLGELNFVLSAVAWGLLGDENNAAPYCLRVYIKGALLTTADDLCRSSSPYVNMLIRGLVDDVVSDLPTAFEDK